MAGFDDLIRGALIKQDSSTPQAREKIYTSARQALARMVEKNPALDATVISAQKSKLDSAIQEIEKSYLVDSSQPSAPPSTSTIPAATPPAPPAPQNPVHPAAAPATTPKPTPAQVTPKTEPAPEPIIAATPRHTTSTQPASSRPASSRQEPAFSTSDTQSLRAEPVRAPARTTPASTTGQAYPDSYRGNALKERKPYAKMLLWTIILVGIGTSIWWAATFGPGLLREQFDGSVPNPGINLNSGSSEPGDINSEGWVTVFSPATSAQNVVTNGSGAAELVESGTQQVMRMASPDGSIGNNLLIKVPRGVMQELRGKAATFEVMVRATKTDAQEFVLFCEFSIMGECGRKRFTAGANEEPFLFDVLINDAQLASDDDAFISLNTDFSGKGRSLDLYSIRVRTGQ